jgi:hypothetical protein
MNHAQIFVTQPTSTGILAAVAVSLATNDEEFIQRAKEAVVLSFWIGLRAQQVSIRHAPWPALNRTSVKS